MPTTVTIHRTGNAVTIQCDNATDARNFQHWLECQATCGTFATEEALPAEMLKQVLANQREILEWLQHCLC